jgi:hypothetical protein
VKALTIIQPFAHLICLPECYPMHKRVENRTWPPPKSAVGTTIAIHAGMAKRYGGECVFDIAVEEYKLDAAQLVFGAVVAVATLSGVVHVSHIEKHRKGDMRIRTGMEWLATHMHAHGPYCWVLQNICPLPKPLPWKGAQGLWEIPDEAIAQAMTSAPATAPTTLFSEASHA